MFFFFFAGMDMHKSFTPTLEVSGFAIRLAFQNLPSMVEPTGSLDSSGITSLCGSWGYKTITKWSVFSSRATKLLRSFPFVRTGRPNHFRRNEKFTYYYFSIRDLSNFKWYARRRGRFNKMFWKSIYHCQNNVFGHGAAGQFWLMESSLRFHYVHLPLNTRLL